MKKMIFLFALVAAIASCSDNSSTNQGTDEDGVGYGPRSTDDDTTAVNVQIVQNANGNMPDTTNSINLGPQGRRDSTDH